jgi:hypothetical protein
MRKLPGAVRDYQESSKNDTINKVQNAIDELKAEGNIVTRKLLLERTGLSNSVLSKPHIKEVLKKNKVCQFALKRKINVIANSVDNDVELKKAYEQIDKLEKKVKELESKIDKEKLAYYKMKEANEVLRGELHILMQKAKLRGLDLDK